ncbi:MAG: hypothetical protein QXK37_03515 [Candidatus Woesearchaeota archaeon]
MRHVLTTLAVFLFVMTGVATAEKSCDDSDPKEVLMDNKKFEPFCGSGEFVNVLYSYKCIDQGLMLTRQECAFGCQNKKCKTGCGDGVCIPDEMGLCAEDMCFVDTCTDSDPEDDIYLRGELAGGTSTAKDYCEGKNLHQYQCKENDGGKWLFSESVTKCEKECKQGVCVSDCEGPVNYNLRKKQTVVYQGKEYNDTCNGNYVTKYKCSPTNKVKSLVFACNFGCEDGTCKKGSEPSICVEQAPGVDYTKQDYIEFMGEIYMDECDGEDQLKEMKCTESGKGYTYELVKCPGGCEDGACKNIGETCNNGVKDEDETGVDCGGACAKPCVCTTANQCKSGEVCVDGMCKAYSCGDGNCDVDLDESVNNCALDCTECKSSMRYQTECQGKKVMECVISNEGWIWKEKEKCRQGELCINGECVDTNTIKCKKSDGGNKFIKGTATVTYPTTDASYELTFTDTCMPDEKKVKEYECRGHRLITRYLNCEHGCIGDDGACKKKVMYDCVDVRKNEAHFGHCKPEKCQEKFGPEFVFVSCESVSKGLFSKVKEVCESKVPKTTACSVKPSCGQNQRWVGTKDCPETLGSNDTEEDKNEEDTNEKADTTQNTQPSGIGGTE